MVGGKGAGKEREERYSRFFVFASKTIEAADGGEMEAATAKLKYVRYVRSPSLPVPSYCSTVPEHKA